MREVYFRSTRNGLATVAALYLVALPWFVTSTPLHQGWTHIRLAALLASPFRNLKNGIHRAAQHQQDSQAKQSLATVRDEEEVIIVDDPDVPENQLIKVSSHVELPFSAEVAYDAYSNLTRQPTWSSWLDSVVMSTDNLEESRWTMKFMGIKYSWTAVALKCERPHTIQWRSVTGLRNYGTVQFKNHAESGDSTIMTMTMTFVAPRAVATFFRKSQNLAKFVEKKMITQSLYGFRDVVLDVDLKKES